MSSPSPFGDDVLPALQTLARNLDPYAKGLIFLAVFFNPYQTLPIPSNSSSVLLLAGAAYLGGYVQIPHLQQSGNPSGAPALPAAFSESLAALQIIYKRFEPYFKVGSLICLTCYVPIHAGLPVSPQPSLIYFLAILIPVLGCFSPTTRLYGPARFGYIEYGQHFAQVYQVLVDWWVYVVLLLVLLSPTFLPLFGVGTVAIGVWVRVSFTYRKELRTISDQVTKDILRAKSAAGSAHDEARAFHGYEEQMIQAATSARRDAVLANAIRITDFFDCASRAWATLGQVTQPAEDAVVRAEELIEAATGAEEADKPDGSDDEFGESHTQKLARYLRQTADLAESKATDVVAQLRVAQENVRSSRTAAQQDAWARAAAENNAAASVDVILRLSARAPELHRAEAAAVKGAEEVSRLSAQALSAARGGEMARARHIAAQSKTAADGIETSLKSVRELKDGALGDLLRWLQSSRKG